MRSLKNFRKNIEGALTRAENSLAMLCEDIRRGLEVVEKEASELEELRLSTAQQLDDANAALKAEHKRAESFKAHAERPVRPAHSAPLQWSKPVEEKEGAPTLILGAGGGSSKPVKRSVHQKILWALGTYGPLTRAQVYYYTGVSPTSSTANTAYAELVDDNHISTDRGVCTITVEGLLKAEVLLTGAPDPYIIFNEFCGRQSKHLQKILRWHYQHKYSRCKRYDLCVASGVSLTSSSTNTAMGRLGHLKIAELGGGLIVFEEWYLKAIRVSISVHDTSRGTSRRHDAVEGKPL